MKDKKYKNIKNLFFYLIAILCYIGLFDLEVTSDTVTKVILIIVVSMIGLWCIFKTKGYFEEIIIFFLFPISFTQLFYNIINSFYETSNTLDLIICTLVMPIGNFLYCYIVIKRNEFTMRELSHLVTFIRCVLFISTIIAFILKNPLFLDGILRDVEINSVELHLKMKLPEYVTLLIQNICIPYLISSTFIKGFIELRNLKIAYRNRVNNKKECV